MMFSKISPKTRKMAALPLAAALVVGTFFFFQKSSSRTESVDPTASDPAVAVESRPAERADTALAPQNPPAPTVASRSSSNQEPSSTAISSAALEPKSTCWSAEYRIEVELQSAQKANFGERDQILGLAPLLKVYPKWSSSRLCVRSQGKAVAFDRDPSSEDRIRIRAGSGRIRPDSRIEVSYCSSSASDCTPCTVEKDHFESSLFGESPEDAAENDEADVTAQLSPEVRRELARLEQDSAPAPISSWTITEAGSSCGKPKLRIAKAGGAQ